MRKHILIASLLMQHAISHQGAFVAYTQETPPPFWMNGTGLAITFSHVLEEGGQSSPISGSPFSLMSGLQKRYKWGAHEGTNMPPGLDNSCQGSRCYQQDFLSNSWFEYGINEGARRLLHLYDEFGIKTSSFIVGLAAINNPQNVEALVASGHEPGCYGLTWTLPVFLAPEEEISFHKDAKDLILRVSGKNCTGFMADWMLDSNNTLSILQDLGLNYHVDDLSRDIPFTKMVCSYADPTKCKPFALVPYTLVNNDIELLGARNFGTEAFYDQLVNEFDTLYRESGQMHRLMSISSHARYGGRPGAVNAYRRFIQYAGSHEGVWFVRKDWMANWALKNGPRYNCSANPVSGETVEVAPGKQVLSAPFCPESSCICGCGAHAAHGSIPCKDFDARSNVV